MQTRTEDGQVVSKEVPVPISTMAEMYTCDVLFRKGQVLCQGFGSTKRQAERNAGVEGLRWLKAHPEC